MSIFGNRMKELREKAGQTQTHVGKLLGKTAAAISKYESGDREPNIGEITNLVKYFNTTADYMFGMSNVTYSMENTALNLKHIMGDYSIDKFVRDVENKTGHSIKVDDVTAYLSGSNVPSEDILEILSEYAGVEPIFFFKPWGEINVNKYSCSEMEELDKYKDSTEFKSVVQLAIRVLQEDIDVGSIEKMLDIMERVKSSTTKKKRS